MKVVCVPVLQDNYSYLLIDRSGTCAVVDPAEPDKVIAAAKKEGVEISMVLTTHKHMDHAGGNNAMLAKIPGLQIIGGEGDEVQGCTIKVQDDDTVAVGSIEVRCLSTPGHTQGHICYYAVEGDEKAVFTGDTLFVGGAGKFFEGTPQDMEISLYKKLGKLPLQTMVYCGHEYTQANYNFALSVDPDNEALQTESKRAAELRSSGDYTVPSSISKELATNPFMRANQAALQVQTGLGSEASTADHLGKIREMKNSFRG